MTKQVHSEESRTKCTYAGRLRTHTHKTLCSFAVDVHKLYISWIWLHQIRLHVCHAHAHILRYAVCHWQSGSQFWHIKYERFNDVVVCLLAAAYCSARAHTQHNTQHSDIRSCLSLLDMNGVPLTYWYRTHPVLVSRQTILLWLAHAYVVICYCRRGIASRHCCVCGVCVDGSLIAQRLQPHQMHQRWFESSRWHIVLFVALLQPVPGQHLDD